jgi:hypothetical protein
LDVQGILTAVQNILPGQAYQDFLDQGGENLQPITVVVAGSESDEQGSSSRLLIGIPCPEKTTNVRRLAARSGPV